VHSYLRAAIQAVGKKGRVIHICHSQGALITHLATKFLTKEEMQQMEVLCFGGGAAIRQSPETPFVRCINYYSTNDPLLFLVPSASKALRSGFMPEDFVFLAPRAGDPVLDHGLLGPTYLKALEWEGRRFQNNYHPWAYRTTRILFVTLFLWGNIISMRMEQLFVIILRPIVRFIVYCVRWLARRVWNPLILSMVLLVEAVKAWYRQMLGMDKYEPITMVGLNERNRNENPKLVRS